MRDRYPRQLPAELRRARGKKVAAWEPSFWGFGPPEPGKGPKPINWRGRLQEKTEPDAEAADADADEPEPAEEDR